MNQFPPPIEALPERPVKDQFIARHNRFRERLLASAEKIAARGPFATRGDAALALREEYDYALRALRGD
jgi:hypothetical protein